MAELITVTEAAPQSSYSHVHIVHLVRTQKIRGRKSGTVWLVDLDSLKEYEKKMEELGPAKHNPIKGEVQ
jgi:hypothetical protein